MATRHTTARGYVRDAAEHTRNALDRLKELKGMNEEELRIEAIFVMERGIVVTGAVLEEVSNGHGSWQDKAKVAAVQSGLPATGVGGILGLMKVFGVI